MHPVLLFILSGAGSASAQATVEPAPAVTLPGSAPSVTIVQPTENAHLTTHRTADPGDKYNAIECLLEAKDRQIRLSTTNWPVKPGGPGVVLVIDHIWSTTVHDLSKPVNLGDLVPYWKAASGNAGVSTTLDTPVSGCGWHSIAAVPILADGRMAPVPPTVTWYYSVPDRGDKPGDPDHAPNGAFVVANLPLIGSFYTGIEDETGYVAKTPDRLPFDYALVNAPGCQAQIDMPGLSDGTMTGQTATLPGPQGLVYVAHASHNEVLLYKVECAYGSGVSTVNSHSQIKIYDHQPKVVGKRIAWPVSGKVKPDGNYFRDNHEAVGKTIRRSRCHDGHMEDCD